MGTRAGGGDHTTVCGSAGVADYALAYSDVAEISPTGDWNLFRITHKDGNPSFRGRWDEKAKTVDLDMMGADDKETRRFTRGGTQCGHHTLEGGTATRYGFQIDLCRPHTATGVLKVRTFVAMRKSWVHDGLGLALDDTATVARNEGDPLRTPGREPHRD